MQAPEKFPTPAIPQRNIADHRTRICSSQFCPYSGWKAPAAVDATALLDSSRSATFVEDQPVVAFVRSTNGDFGDTDARLVAYKFLSGDGSSVQIPAGLDPMDDPAHLIAGYRVWCHDGDGAWRHLRRSFKTGFLDVAAPSSIQRHYQVTSCSRNAIESLPSGGAIVTPGPIEPTDRIFANGFD